MSTNVPKTIMVGFDFSTYAEHALDYAMQLAAGIDATVHVVSALAIPPPGAPEVGLGFTAVMIDNLVAENQASLEKIAASHRGDARVGKVIVRTGDARDVILAAADELGADLIVIGTHGRRGITRALLGSVAEAVIRRASVPVLAVRKRTR